MAINSTKLKVLTLNSNTTCIPGLRLGLVVNKLLFLATGLRLVSYLVSLYYYRRNCIAGMLDNYARKPHSCVVSYVENVDGFETNVMWGQRRCIHTLHGW